MARHAFILWSFYCTIYTRITDEHTPIRPKVSEEGRREHSNMNAAHRPDRDPVFVPSLVVETLQSYCGVGNLSQYYCGRYERHNIDNVNREGDDTEDYF